MRSRGAALLLALAAAGAAHAQSDLLAPLHGPMTTPVRTPQDAEAVCTSVLVAQFVEKTIERVGVNGRPALTENEALGQLASDPSWAGSTVPMIHAICRCAIGRMAGGGSDLLGRMTTNDSAQAFVQALQQPDTRAACIASAQAATQSSSPPQAPASDAAR